MRMHWNGEWVGVLGQILVACEGAPLVIEPDEVHHNSLDIMACLEVGNCGPRFKVPPTSSTPYRIFWPEAYFSYTPDTYPHGKLIPLEERLSNTFTLQVQPY